MPRYCDHGVHLRGRELLPSEEYRVPVLFLSPGRVAPARIEEVTSQLDIAPTIMGLVGGRYRSPFFGRDVLASPGSEGFAVMIYGKRHYGVRRADRLTVVRGGGARAAYRVSAAGELQATRYAGAYAEDAADALALAQVAEQLVQTRSYHTRPRQSSASR